MINLSLHLDREALTSILILTADFGNHTEITLQGVLHRDYTLRLFIENQELDLHTQDNRIWTLAQRPCAPFFSLNAPTDICACVEVFPRHPSCAPKSI